MKRIFVLLLAVAMTIGIFTGCASDPKTDISKQKIAFITDIGDVNDHGYNQYSYEGVVTFAEEHHIPYRYYQPEGEKEEQYEAAFNKAIADENTVVVMAGFYLAKACYKAALENPDVLFLALDITLADMGAEKMPENLAVITYKDEQTGFLAGYAAVADGYKNLGFLGGVDMYAVVHYGYGFVQGAELAAKDLGIEGVNIQYWYSDSFIPNADIEAKMTEWYDEGTEVVFSCGGAIYESCLAAAAKCDGKMIGVDVDQSYLSERVITSAAKSLSHSVVLALTEAAENGMKWPDAYAGKIQKFGAKENGIGLPMASSRFTAFDEATYKVLFDKLANGTVVVDDSSDSSVHPEVSHITVDWQS